MWKEYSISFVRKNRASSIFIMSAALAASMLLSLLCSFFYNMWVYDVESVILEEGDWQGRITGELSEDDISLIRGFANVEKVVIHEKEFTVLDLYFSKPSRIYQDMTLLSQKLGLEKEQVTYNYQLLSMYFIRIPGDDKPRMNFPFYVAVTLTVCFSLILVIHNSFAVSMNARVRQLGILSSIGAAPQQIRACLIEEAAMLCALPIAGGSLVGIGISCGLLKMMNMLAVQMTGRHDTAFRYHPLIFIVTVVISALTVLISAWIPARKLAKMTPLEAIRGADEIQLRRKKHSPFLSLLFGIEGELAGNALKAQKKALRTSTLSLTLSFFGFTIMMCFFKLSNISTDYTYFARYQNVWDVMATVHDVKIEDFDLMETVQEAVKKQGASDLVVYQKALAAACVPVSEISDELHALGGLKTVAGESGAVAGQSAQDDTFAEENYLIQAPIIILDDNSFQKYCEQAGVVSRLDGAIVINRIWDSINSNFRYPEYIPYLKEDRGSTILQDIEIPVLGYTEKEPVLREEYDDYTLVHVIPLSLWKSIAGEIGQNAAVESDAYIRVLADRNTSFVQVDVPDEQETIVQAAERPEGLLEQLNQIEETLTQAIGHKYEIETENRVQEKITNDQLILGYQIVIGIFCALLAVIGIANVFSYTMGFIRQRRRECARYLSVGMTPDGLKKMFRIETLVIAGRPVLITLPVTVLAVSFMIRASYLNPAEFWSQAPYVPVLVFIMVIFGSVALAYRIGGRRILQDSLVEALRNDAVV